MRILENMLTLSSRPLKDNCSTGQIGILWRMKNCFFVFFFTKYLRMSFCLTKEQLPWGVYIRLRVWVFFGQTFLYRLWYKNPTRSTIPRIFWSLHLTRINIFLMLFMKCAARICQMLLRTWNFACELYKSLVYFSRELSE